MTTEADLLSEGKLKELMGRDGKLDPAKVRAFVHDYTRQAFEAERTSERTSDAAAVRRLPMGEPEGGAAWSRNFINRQIASTPGAPGRVLDGEFAGFGALARAIHPEVVQRDGLPASLRNDMSSVVGADGGFLIPEILRANVLGLSLERSIVRPRATVLPMTSLTLLVPTVDDPSHASSVLGGVIAYWMPESGTITETMPAFGRLMLEAKKLTAYTEVPNELIADSAPALDVLLEQGFSRAVSWFEDYAFLRGGGVGEPLGVLNSSALVTVAKESGQAADTILWENIIKIFARALPESQGRGVWVASNDTLPELATMSLSVGTGGSAIWLGNGAGSAPPTILGRPLFFTEKVPALGNAGDIGFYDFSEYLIGDRQAMSLAISPHFKFQNDQTAYRLIERVDGRPWNPNALTPKNGGATLSAFVTLAERA